ncbi:MAG: hypothetical protein U0U67_00815 [Chitinophagales bacterium]
MKKLIILTVFAVSLFAGKQANATEKGDFNVYLTTNLGHHSFIPERNFSLRGLGFIPGVTLNMDYAASKYFGIGGWFTFSGKRYGTDLSGTSGYYKYRNFGVGMRGVFHLYQLISEKGNAKLDADKFDVYIPLAIGGGFRLADKNIPGDKFRAGAIVGSGIGVSYYFVEHIGGNLEAGYLEGSYAKLGLVFKF